MAKTPNKLPFRLEEMRRARDANDMKAFASAVIRSVEELERAWPLLVSDITNAEKLP
jgi:hypothetical protein